MRIFTEAMNGLRTSISSNRRILLEGTDQAAEAMMTNWLEGREEDVARLIASNRFLAFLASMLIAIPSGVRMVAGMWLAETLAHGNIVPDTVGHGLAATLRTFMNRNEQILESAQLTEEELEARLTAHFDGEETARAYREDEKYCRDHDPVNAIIHHRVGCACNIDTDGFTPMTAQQVISFAANGQARYCSRGFPPNQPRLQEPTAPVNIIAAPVPDYLDFVTPGRRNAFDVDAVLQELGKADVLNVGGLRTSRKTVVEALKINPKAVQQLREISDADRDAIIGDMNELLELHDAAQKGAKDTVRYKLLHRRARRAELQMRGFINAIKPAASVRSQVPSTGNAFLDSLGRFGIWASDFGDDFNTPDRRVRLQGVMDTIFNPDHLNRAGRTVYNIFMGLAVTMIVLLVGALGLGLTANIGGMIAMFYGDLVWIAAFYLMLVIATIMTYGGAIILQIFGGLFRAIGASVLGLQELVLGDSASDRMAGKLIPLLKKAKIVDGDLKVVVDVIRAKEERESVNRIAHFSWILTLVATANTALKGITLIFIIASLVLPGAAALQMASYVIPVWEIVSYSLLGIMAVYATINRDKFPADFKRRMAKKALQFLLLIAIAWIGSGILSGLLLIVVTGMGIAHFVSVQVALGTVATTLFVAFAYAGYNTIISDDDKKSSKKSTKSDSDSTSVFPFCLAIGAVALATVGLVTVTAMDNGYLDALTETTTEQVATDEKPTPGFFKNLPNAK